MIRRLILVFTFCATFLQLSKPAHAQDTGWVINHFHANINILENTRVEVTEEITVDFSNLHKHGIYRTIPVKYKTAEGNNLDIRFKLHSVVDEKGKPYQVQQSKSGSNIELKIGDPDRTVSGEHIYVINYEVRRVLTNPSDSTEFYWNVTGHEWPVSILNTTATITAPPQSILDVICFAGLFGSYNQDCDSKIGDQAAIFASGQRRSGEGLTVAVMLDRTKFIFPSFIEELIWFIQDNWLYGVPLISLILMFYLYLQKGRDERYIGMFHEGITQKTKLFEKVDPHQVFGPPENLSPGEVGVLVDERVDSRDLTAVAIDLARRGYFTITEKKKGIFNKSSFTLTNNNKDEAELREFEKHILDMLFTKSRISESNLDKLNKNAYKYHDLAKQDLYHHALQSGLFINNPQSIRNAYLGAGTLLLFISMGLAPIVGEIFNNLDGAYFALFATSLIIIAFSFFMPARSAKGRRALAEVVGLREWVRIGAWRERIHEKHNFLEEVLPYTIAFGLTHKFLNAFKEAELKELSWYQSSQPLSPMRLSQSLDSFGTSTVHAVSATRPKSSASSGGSGFGGGGFSGGGFGGGGGGSW